MQHRKPLHPAGSAIVEMFQAFLQDAALKGHISALAASVGDSHLEALQAAVRYGALAPADAAAQAAEAYLYVKGELVHAR